MAHCKLCNRSGIFLKITKLGVCQKCEPAASVEILQRWKVINESMKIVSKSRVLETRLGRCDDIIQNATPLLKYESAGVQFISKPSSLINLYTDMKDVLRTEDELAKRNKAVSKKNAK